MEGGLYDIIEEVDDIVERFRQFFPENHHGIPHRLFTLPPKVMLECVGDHLHEMISYEKHMLSYDQPHDEICLFEKNHFRLLSHSLDILNRQCRKYYANPRMDSRSVHVMSFKNILEAYDMFKAIINHIEQNYNVTFPTTLTGQDTDWSDIKELFQRIKQYPFIQESQLDDAEAQNEAVTETAMEIDYGDEADADDEDEAASNLGDYFT
jgi:hypothetical protein